MKEYGEILRHNYFDTTKDGDTIMTIYFISLSLIFRNEEGLPTKIYRCGKLMTKLSGKCPVIKHVGD